MKKLFVMTAMFFAVCGAQAQLNVIEENAEGTVKEMTLQMYWNWLYRIRDNWYYVTKTDNQFAKEVWIYLGSDAESVTATCRDLLSLIDRKVKFSLITDVESGEKITLSYDNNLGVKRLNVKADGHAGVGCIYKGSLNRIIKRMGGKEEENGNEEENE